VTRLAAETGVIEAPTLDIAAVSRACRNRPVVFVRHLFEEYRRIPGADQEAITAEIDRLVARLDPGAVHALQVWQDWPDGTLPPGLRTDELWRALARRIEHRGHVIERANGDQTISVCLTPRETVIGLNPPGFALADWPGGRVGLAKTDAQVSRSEFKLEELFKTAGLDLPSRGVALDLGASPGGWTRILRRRGLTVWAIDPAALDPSWENRPVRAAPST
jgi:23S rRNA (cytidine2498-2'-O)-methyltransferase